MKHTSCCEENRRSVSAVHSPYRNRKEQHFVNKFPIAVLCCFCTADCFRAECLREKGRLLSQTAQIIRKFLCSLNQTGLQAGSTYVHFLCASVNLNSNGLHIGIPDSVRLSIGMTYIVAKKNTLCADFTLSHHRTSLTKLGGLV